ncbi:MAG: 4-carboxy-4-hydroxy-2-oxoadipate aldolase/oxaloacetate decarboxylase [Chloroflexota bacterium]
MNNSQITQLSKLPSATVHEALGGIGALPSRIKPIHACMTVCGPAVTVETRPGDNLTIHRALSDAPAGSVLIVSTDGAFEYGYWGEIMAVAAQARGIVGLVIDGCIRDAEPIEKLKFPVFSRGLSILGTSKKGNGRINEPLVIGSITIFPNDIVLGDRDGVVIVPEARVQEAIEKSIAREARELEMMNQLRAGRTTLDILGLE